MARLDRDPRCGRLPSATHVIGSRWFWTPQLWPVAVIHRQVYKNLLSTFHNALQCFTFFLEETSKLLILLIFTKSHVCFCTCSKFRLFSNSNESQISTTWCCVYVVTLQYGQRDRDSEWLRALVRYGLGFVWNAGIDSDEWSPYMYSDVQISYLRSGNSDDSVLVIQFASYELYCPFRHTPLRSCGWYSRW